MIGGAFQSGVSLTRGYSGRVTLPSTVEGTLTDPVRYIPSRTIYVCSAVSTSFTSRQVAATRPAAVWNDSLCHRISLLLSIDLI
jgi:hypothetical protein